MYMYTHCTCDDSCIMALLSCICVCVCVCVFKSKHSIVVEVPIGS